MKVVAIVLAAGRGLRMKIDFPKPYILLSDIPILIRALKILANHRLIDEIIVVANKSFIKKTRKLVDKYKLNKIKKIVAGGKDRVESVYNGLGGVSSDAEFILIHDGVRPFLSDDIITRTIFGATRFGACICGVPVKPTIKQINKNRFIQKTLDRKNIWEIQTPQVFRKDLILKAYKRLKDIEPTDDSMLVERMGARVKIVMGSYSNIKITTPEDLIVAEAICRLE